MTIRRISVAESAGATPRGAADAADSAGRVAGLAGVVAVAALALLSLPGARAASTTFGWTPLWLLALPAAAALAVWLAGRVRMDPEAGAGNRRRRARRAPGRLRSRLPATAAARVAVRAA